VEVADPTSSEGLAAAGLLEADALLLAPDAVARSSPAEADAHVLGTMLEVQHLLACVQRPGSPQQQQQQQSAVRQLGSWESRVSRRFGFGRNRSIGRRKDGDAAAAAVAAAEQQQSAAAAAPAVALRKLHVVACVATTSATAVAASFFGDASGTKSGKGNSSSSGSGAVVGCCPFSYELIVHGEVESAVLLQVRR
jgi:S1-C subfamily serine protease